MRLRSFCAMRPPGSPREGDLGRLNIPAAGERPPRARPWRRGSPGPVPNPAVKPAVAESTAEEVRGRLGSRARGGRSSIARGPPRAGARKAPDASRARGLSAFRGPARARGLLAHCGGGCYRALAAFIGDCAGGFDCVGCVAEGNGWYACPERFYVLGSRISLDFASGLWLFFILALNDNLSAVLFVVPSSLVLASANMISTVCLFGVSHLISLTLNCWIC